MQRNVIVTRLIDALEPLAVNLISILEEQYQQRFDCLESELRSDLEVLHKEIKSKEKVETQVHGPLYNDNVHCCLELLSMNVDIYQVGPIIRCDLKNLKLIHYPQHVHWSEC